MKSGLLIINLGTPEGLTKKEIRKFLREFLLDKYVIQIPLLFRLILVLGIIIPFRTTKTTSAYKKIWTKDGSPLFIYQQSLKNKLQQYLGSNYKVALGFRYTKPSLKEALHELQDCKKIIILPLYPQYSSSTTQSSVEAAQKLINKLKISAQLKIIKYFYQNESFLTAQANQIKPFIEKNDFILFSYHSVPENHLLIDTCKTLCKQQCNKLSKNYSICYRNQCIQTTNKIANLLNLDKSRYTISFQSRLGRIKWISPYTDEILVNLRQQGIKKLAVTCPSFVSDCLETLEEINITLNQQWLNLGGQSLTLIPALNDNDNWVESIASIIKS